jgi:hypothetical protein
LPWFFGSDSSATLSGVPLYEGLTKASLITSPFTTITKTFTFVDGDYIYIAIPAIWGKTIASIVDNGGKGDDVISAFEMDTKTVTRTGSIWSTNYYVYKTILPNSAGEQEFEITLA